MAHPRTTLLPAFLALMLGAAAMAQEARIDLGGLRADPKAPVEVTADSFAVDQATSEAVFSGAVRIAQGEMVITADSVTIEYAEDGKGIRRLLATGGVVLRAGANEARADSADYDIGAGEVTLTGDVVLTQGSATISGQRMVVNLADGTGRIEGGVTTTFVPGGN